MAEAAAPTKSATELYVEYSELKDRLKVIKNELKGTPFWKVVREDGQANKVNTGGVTKKKKEKIKGAKKAK
jgi:hypothetical protein